MSTKVLTDPVELNRTLQSGLQNTAVASGSSAGGAFSFDADGGASGGAAAAIESKGQSSGLLPSSSPGPYSGASAAPTAASSNAQAPPGGAGDMTDLLPPEAARVMSLAPVCDVMQLPPLPPAEAIG